MTGVLSSRPLLLICITLCPPLLIPLPPRGSSICYPCFSLQVLFLVEPIDEVAVTSLASFKDKKFVDISKEELDLGGWLHACVRALTWAGDCAPAWVP